MQALMQFLTPYALLRGRYMKAVAWMEHNGIPIDIEFLARLLRYWDEIQEKLISEIDQVYGVFEGKTFKVKCFSKYLIRHKIPWPLLPSGHLELKDDTFKYMAKVYPEIALLRELRVSLSQLRLTNLTVGPDGRNRCMLSAFSARTGRNQPKTSEFIFGKSSWLRSLIKPKPGTGIAYIDYGQQEFAIAAALSGDKQMQEAYQSGDPYLAFAKQAGAVPPNATKKSHKAERAQFKECALAVQYGMGANSLAERIGQPVIRARELLRLHRETYHVFWAWSDSALDYAMLYGKLWTTFGWTIHINTEPNPLFLRNFLMQANGSEMLRLACCMVSEAGIKVCAPIHDAILIEAPLDELDDIIAQTQALMAEASAIILGGFEVNTDVDIIRYPDRYMDERGTKMWNTVNRILNDLESSTCS